MIYADEGFNRLFCIKNARITVETPFDCAYLYFQLIHKPLSAPRRAKHGKGKIKRQRVEL